MSVLKCISPVDGSVFAERDILEKDAAEAVVAKVRVAQPGWAARPLAERIELVKAGINRLNEMKEEVVPELAHMMGRPIRYGGEFGGVNERTAYMAEIAERALSPIVIEESDKWDAAIGRY